jgi:hypothetical protein
VALLLENRIIFNPLLSVFPWRYAWLDAFVAQGLSEPVGVITSIRQKVFNRWQSIDNEPGAVVIAHLSFGQAQDDRATVTVTNRMKFGVQSAFCPSDTAGNIPFLSRLAAVRCYPKK